MNYRLLKMRNSPITSCTEYQNHNIKAIRIFYLSLYIFCISIILLLLLLTLSKMIQYNMLCM